MSWPTGLPHIPDFALKSGTYTEDGVFWASFGASSLCGCHEPVLQPCSIHHLSYFLYQTCLQELFQCSSCHHGLLDEYSNPPSEDYLDPFLHGFTIIDSEKGQLGIGFSKNLQKRIPPIQETLRRRELPNGVVMLPGDWLCLFLKLLFGSNS